MNRLFRILCCIAAFAVIAPASAADLNPDFSEFHSLHRILTEQDYTPAAAPIQGDLRALATTVHDKYEHGFAYLASEKQYGSSNYWPTRDQTLQSHKADCKGFAVAAYYDLLEAGVPEDRLFIWVVVLKKTKEIHAVVRVGDYVIDRMVARVITLKEARGIYTNIYRFNRLGWTAEDNG